MLSVTNKLIMLSVGMLNVVILSFVAPLERLAGGNHSSLILPLQD
jgi:hypothetical protein